MTEPTATALVMKAVHKHLIEQGKIVEAGFVGFRALCFPQGAPQQQIDIMRDAFFAGSQHLFASIMTVLDPDAEVTDADMKTMENIDAELRAFGQKLSLRVAKTEGRA